MNNKEKTAKAVRYITAAFVWLLVWFAVSRKIDLELVLPSPISVLSALRQLLADGSFRLSCLKSFASVIAGFAAGSLSGVILGAAVFAGKWADAFISPLLHIIRATPVASFIILCLVLMKNGNIPAFISALTVIPAVADNTRQGLSSPDKKLLEAANAFGVNKKNRIKFIYAPAVYPYIIAACRTGAGMAWKSGIAAEVICLPAKTIGRAIYDSKIYLDTPGLFAWTAAVILLSVLFAKAVALCARLFMKRGNAK